MYIIIIILQSIEMKVTCNDNSDGEQSVKKENNIQEIEICPEIYKVIKGGDHIEIVKNNVNVCIL